MIKTRNSILFTLWAFALSFSVNAAQVSGNGVLNINDASDPRIQSYDTSTVNLLAGADVGFLDAYDISMVNVMSGSMVSHLDVFDTSRLDVQAASEISFIKAFDQATVEITGGDVSWLELEENAHATIFGSDFTYRGGILRGNWADGTSFQFWALNLVLGSPPPLTDFLPSNITLTNLPVPPALLLFLSGLLPLFIGIRKNRSAAG